MRRIALGGMAILVAAGVAACGGTTVEGGDGTENTVAPLTRSQGASASAEKSGEKTESTRAASESAAEPARTVSEQDSGAREIESLPEPQGATTPEEQGYLDLVADGGVDTQKVSDQLIAAAQSVCTAAAEGTEGDATAQAIGGQLVEQGFTELDAQKAAELIENSAREAYC
ncbi:MULTISPECIES: DUF732 domain-containing protein [unclassified Corynebacterium]|uniref:DUF732 domain-containing protein n=1 Tax=unclassified Corynebacterium TaxID=2624378 RepID=UPI0029C9B324|nr:MULTISPECIES: DUF732 domain-containing protein [unclassified Corynebacterium]WPF66018.1 DUF732 domain-containing protein [Corynebacterium sp. 22KM0430]WPF68511.1 DUF732 domain-containing protein [Corynebacterium sp. 21KM1197]